MNNKEKTQRYPESIAAVDLGSNSFHLIVASVDEMGNIKMIDQLKEMVRLRGGLDSNNNMDEVVAQRALDCLQRIGDRIRHLEEVAVRAAGTNTLRTMNSAASFLKKANKALGHRIEIIPGHEEARLVYLGVSHTLSDDRGKQLVIDIGGGSTEFIIGKKFESLNVESLNIGSVSVTKRFFPNGDLCASHWQTANTALRLEIFPIQQAFSSNNWKRAIGSSGTIKATLAILQEENLQEFGISLNGLYQIREKIISFGNIEDIELAGLKPDRAPVYAGGLAVLIAAFEALKIEHMAVSEGALREGLLYDMLGRINHEDVRYRTVQNYMQRFSIDVAQAERVKKTALHCFHQARKAWNIPKKKQLSLAWACDLHELGLSITHDKHQLQGAHILKYADMPGFARRRQQWLAVLVKSHRKKFDPEILETLPEDERQTIYYLIILLRLAVLLHRSRIDEEILPDIECSVDSLHLKSLNSEEKALIEADLAQEKEWLERTDFKLFFS